MEANQTTPFRVAIACGGTGGHFFPGVAVGHALARAGARVVLIASEKSVDQESAKGLKGLDIRTLPAVGLVGRRWGRFLWGLSRSLVRCFGWFMRSRPDAVLIMGGFTSVAPAVLGRVFGARVYLHESNSVPGRANRWLQRCCHGVFVGFSGTQSCFSNPNVTVTGTPVRDSFSEGVTEMDYKRLGLESSRPILLIMGGSQGAEAINELMIQVAPLLATRRPEIQFLHLTGHHDQSSLRAMYTATGARFCLREFVTDTAAVVQMATAGLSRSGASSLAEFAAVGLPTLLVPYPTAVDQHQQLNAEYLVRDGAARVIEQDTATPEQVMDQLDVLLFDSSVRSQMGQALRNWDPQEASKRIASHILRHAVAGGRDDASTQPSLHSNESPSRSNTELQLKQVAVQSR